MPPTAEGLYPAAGLRVECRQVPLLLGRVQVGPAIGRAGGAADLLAAVSRLGRLAAYGLAAIRPMTKTALLIGVMAVRPAVPQGERAALGQLAQAKESEAKLDRQPGGRALASSGLDRGPAEQDHGGGSDQGTDDKGLGLEGPS